ncbi:hypothetical protein AB4Y89_24375 [Terriglobus sp. 2YAB30_2]|uniref:hypothetical protein n=1 Tax=Terriglobus sp. 2YAB30_2 TaxID=3233023 RepID=UPI003F96AF14
MSDLGDLRRRWSKLAGQASSGNLEFEEYQAQMCVQACETALSGLKAIQGCIFSPPAGWQPLNALPEFGRRPSGISMAGAFNGRAKYLSDILGAHFAIVAEMANAFSVAGKAYLEAEAESRHNFANVAPAAISGGPAKIAITRDVGFGSNERNAPNVETSAERTERVIIQSDPRVKEFKEALDGKRIEGNASKSPALVVRPVYLKDGVVDENIKNPDAAESLLYHDLYKLGQTIKPQPIADAGSTWLYLAEWLQRLFADLADTIDNSRDSWSGFGGEAARKAVQDYVAATGPLVDDMTKIGNNLSKAGVWLNVTKWSMPQTEAGGPGYKDYDGVLANPGSLSKEDPTPVYQQRYEDYYRVNFQESRVVPMLTAPDPVPVGAGVGGPRSSAGGSGGSSGYSGGVPGPGLTAASVDTSGLTGALPGAGGGLDPASGVGDPPVPPPTSPSGPDSGQLTSQLANMAQQAMSGAQTAAEAAGRSAVPPVGGMNMDKAAADAAKASRFAAGAKGGGVGGGGAPLAKEAALAKGAAQSKLFPRAGLPGTVASTAIGRAGMAPITGAPGTPGAASPHGAGKDQGKEHKRADFLGSTRHLEEAIGEPVAIKPVLDE